VKVRDGRGTRLALTALLAVILIGTGLRFFRIGAQSYWNDEGNSLVLASRTPGEIARAAAADIHPPGYYLALSAWRAAAGDTELALRGFSALAGVVLLALLYRLGREYFGWRPGIAAASVGAVHPFLIYYSQEARMYALLAALAAASFLLFSRWLRSSRPPASPAGDWRLGLGFSLATAAGLYTHYAFSFVLLAQNVALLGGLLAHGQRAVPGAPSRPWAPRLAAWLGWQAVGLAMFAPWLPVAWRQLTTWPAERTTLSFGLALAELGRYLAVGRTLAHEAATVGVLGLVVLLLFGLRARGQTITPFLWLLVPAGLILALGLLTEPFAKFLVAVVPAVCVLLGAAVAHPPAAGGPAPRSEPRPAPAPGALSGLWVLSLAALLLGNWRSLDNLYFNPAYYRDDYRGIASHLAGIRRPGDAVITIAPNQVEAFGYYHRHGAPVYPLPQARPLDPAATAQALEQISAAHPRIFVLFWGEQQADPDSFVEGWLNRNAFKAGDSWFGQVRLATYAAAQPAPQPSAVSGARFGDRIVLEGFSLAELAAAPGDILQLTLFWRADSPVQQRYKVFVHLYDDIHQPPLAQQDGEPGGGFLPSDAWPIGERVADNHGVLLPADLPAGEYRLMVGLYNLSTGERLPVTLGSQAHADRLLIGTLAVTGQ
jgi:mannosyltransferase